MAPMNKDIIAQVLSVMAFEIFDAQHNFELEAMLNHANAAEKTTTISFNLRNWSRRLFLSFFYLVPNTSSRVRSLHFYF